MATVKSYIDKNKERFLEELFDFIRIPSVSAKEENKSDMLRAADFLKDSLLKAGADKAEIYPTSGHPVLYGEKIISTDLPTILVYGHYDVQPAEPIDFGKLLLLNLWSETVKYGAGELMMTRVSYLCMSRLLN